MGCLFPRQMMFGGRQADGQSVQYVAEKKKRERPCGPSCFLLRVCSVGYAGGEFRCV